MALGADVVVHTPLPSLVHGDEPGRDVDDFCRLLAAGSNVITTVGYMYPAAHGPELVDRLDDRGRRRGRRRSTAPAPTRAGSATCCRC